MKLGEMLMQDGRLTAAELDQAIARQARDGGRFGTVLVESGLIDADTLTVYLGLELGIPIATRATLDRAKRSAVKLLRPEQAARLRCVPIIIQDRQLIAALADPLDWQVLDELSRITGYRIIPRVAPEMRIFHYLELFYGVPRPPRFLKLAETVPDVGSVRDLPAPPLPGLPPRTERPLRAPTPPPVLRTRAGEPAKDEAPATPDAATDTALKEAPVASSARLSTEQEALEIDAADLVVELDADETETAPEAATPVPNAPAPAKPPPVSAQASRPAAKSKQEAIDAMAAAAQRGEIADAILAYAAGMFDVAALLMVRDNMAFGWKAFGTAAEPGRIELLLVPLEAPSMFQVAVHSQVFSGRPFPSTVHNHFYKVMACAPAPYAVAVVIKIGRRVVNLIYGHRREDAPLSEAETGALADVAAAATQAYVRLIADSKTRGPS